MLQKIPGVGKISNLIRRSPVLSPWRLNQAVWAEEVTDGSIENLRILWPAEKVSFELDELDRRFLQVCKYFNDGTYSRRNIFTCEVPDAYVHVATGLTCTRDFKAIIDCHYDRRRMETNWQYGRAKPGKTRRRKLPATPPGARYAVVSDTWSFNWHHFLSDNLTRLYSISRAYPNDRIIVLTQQWPKSDWRDLVAASLPPNFEVHAVKEDIWLEVDRLVLPSFVTARGNYHIPPGYYEPMRQYAFAHLGLPPQPEPRERIYVSRKNGRSRRVLNEDELVEFLKPYGFRSILPEKMPFKEQVDLYRRAEIVAGVYGANWALNVYSGPIKNLVLYADRNPETYVFTFSKALGQAHHFLTGASDDANADFHADLGAVKRVLEDEMGLKPV